jgi:hypothetical protein
MKIRECKIRNLTSSSHCCIFFPFQGFCFKYILKFSMHSPEIRRFEEISGSLYVVGWNDLVWGNFKRKN